MNGNHTCQNIITQVTLRTVTIDMCSGVNVHVQNAAAQLFKIYYHQSSGTKLVKHEGGWYYSHKAKTEF